MNQVNNSEAWKELFDETNRELKEYSDKFEETNVGSGIKVSNEGQMITIEDNGDRTRCF